MTEVEIDDSDWIQALPEAPALIRSAAAAALGVAAARAERDHLVVLLTDDETVRALNARFRGQDKATNVLSFPAAATAGQHLGDLALALGVCANEADQRRKHLADHLQHLIVHGVLHLLGYDHRDDAEAESMEALERRILTGLGASDPYDMAETADAPYG